MLIGKINIDSCGHCHFYQWAGENRTKGDLGNQCDQGAFYGVYETPKEIPETCPFNDIRVQVVFNSYK